MTSHDITLIIGAVFTGVTTLFGMYIAYQLRMVHTAVNSEREALKKIIAEQAETILRNAVAKAKADSRLVDKG